MGERSRKWKIFHAAHPVCAFCGGVHPAETFEHYPPKATFYANVWPEGFEFPACKNCNDSSRDDDLVIALVARMKPFRRLPDDGKTNGLMARLRQRRPGLLDRMIPTAREARQMGTLFPHLRQPGKTVLESQPFVKFTTEVRESIEVFSRKLAKAIYYKETASIFPNDGCLMMTWSTNIDIVAEGEYQIFKPLRELPGTVPPIVREKKILHDQFAYKWTFSTEPDGSRFLLQVRIAESFAFVVFGSPEPNILEKIVSHATENTGRKMMVLQSQSMKVDVPF